MKKLVLAVSLFAVMLCGNVKCQNQFDNNSFEIWNNANGLPTGWSTLAISIPFMGDYPLCNIDKDNSAVDGNYSARLTPAPLPEMLTQLAKQVGMEDQLLDIPIPALLTNATINLSMESLSSLAQMFQDGGSNTETDMTEMLSSFMNILSDGLPIPDGDIWVKNIKGYYKFAQESEADRVMLAAMVINNDNGIKTIVGGGVLQEVAPSDEFAQFTIPVTNLSKGNELIFIAVASSFSVEMNYGTPLYLDNISIEYEGKDVSDPIVSMGTNPDNWAIYPNPAVNKTFRLSTQKPQSVKIYNVNGVLVKEITSYKPQSEIQLEESGIYFVQTGGKTAKITIE